MSTPKIIVFPRLIQVLKFYYCTNYRQGLPPAKQKIAKMRTSYYISIIILPKKVLLRKRKGGLQ